MRKLITIAALALAATGLSIAPAQAERPATVTVCHATGQANSADSGNTYTWHIGHEITVSEKAFEQAFVGQGDPDASTFASGYYITPAHSWWATLADVDGAVTSGNCAYRY